MISLDWPWVLLLLPLPWLLRRMLPPAQVGAALPLPIAEDLRRLGPPKQHAPWRGGLLAAIAWLLLVIAGAQPRWTGAPILLPIHGRDLLLAVDISGSMAEKDAHWGKHRVSRLEAARTAAADFLSRRTGDRVGLILFGSSAYLHAPLSLDRTTVARLLQDAEVGLAGDGTAIGDAIATGVHHLRESTAKHRVMILLTDGENTAGSIEPQKAAAFAAEAGIVVHTVAFGPELGEFDTLALLGLLPPGVREAGLKEIARVTHGRHFRAKTAPELQEVYRLLDEIEPTEVESRTLHPTRNLFHWPLAAAMSLVVLMVLRRQLRT